MIYTNISTQKLEFQKLLEATKKCVLQELNVKLINSGNKFESFVFEKMKMCSKGTIFNSNLYQTSDREFPDIIANGYWGVEVKFTKDDKWESIGNSVLESSRVSTVEKIYLFFGKCGGVIDIQYRPYEECLKGISVTHYPRYRIDMNLPIGESIFDQMGISYDELRIDDKPITKIKQFYRKNLKENNSLWWIDDKENSANKSFEIISFNNLGYDEKRRMIAEGFILFPEIFGNEKDKYAKLCSFWVSFYSIICPNMRDLYSAGGKVDFSLEKINEEEKHLAKKFNLLEINRLCYNFLFKFSDIVKEILDHIDLDIVTECWGEDIKNRYIFLQKWKEKIDSYTRRENFTYSISVMFEEL